MPDGKRTCSRCGKPVAQGQSECDRCVSQARNASVDETQKGADDHGDLREAAHSMDGVASESVFEIPPDGGSEHPILPHEPQTRAYADVAETARLRRRHLLTVAAIAANLAVLATIVFLIARSPRVASPFSASSPGRVSSQSHVSNGGFQPFVGYVTLAGTPERALEEAALQKGLYGSIKSLAITSDAIVICLQKEAYWDLAQLRSNAEADAVNFLKTANSVCPGFKTITLDVSARLEGKGDLNWASALKVSCSRADSEKAASKAGGDSNLLLQMLGAEYHPRLASR
jgi:hypothetical protein